MQEGMGCPAYIREKMEDNKAGSVQVSFKDCSATDKKKKKQSDKRAR